MFHHPGGVECGLPWTLLLPADVVLAVRMTNKVRLALYSPWRSALSALYFLACLAYL